MVGGGRGAAGGGRGRLGAARGGREAQRAPGDQYLEKQRRCRQHEKDLSGIRWPFLTEGLSKVDVSAKNYFLAAIQK